MSTDLLSVTRERAQDNLFWRYLGVEVDDAGEGWARLRVPVQDAIRNAAGAPVHGGVYSALVDMAVGGVGQSTLDLNVSFLAAGMGPEIVAEGRILRRGRTIAFGEARITDGADTVLAVGRATYMIIAPRA